MNQIILRIIYTNFWRHPFRSIGLVILTAVASATLLSSALFSESLDAGLEQLSSRMGADLLIVPYGSEAKDQPVLLQGELSHRTLPREILEFTRKTPGIKIATSQFYFSTLGSSCCDKKVNIIGFDSKTDFTIKPWIRKTYKKDFPIGSVIAGSDIQVDESGKIKFFDQEFTVVAHLERMGNKLDQAIFADVGTIEILQKAAKEKGINFISEGEPSAILANLEKGTDFEKISQTLHEKFDNIHVIPRKDLFDNVIATAGSFKIIVWVIAVFFLIVSIAAVSIAFSISANERKREFATLRVIGFTQKRLEHIVLGESLLATIIGTVVGAFISVFATLSFRVFIIDSLSVPFLLPSALTIFAIIIVAIFIPTITGTGAAYRIAKQVGRLDVYSALKEET